jgi:hypothetical protein
MFYSHVIQHRAASQLRWNGTGQRVVLQVPVYPEPPVSTTTSTQATCQKKVVQACVLTTPPGSASSPAPSGGCQQLLENPQSCAPPQHPSSTPRRRMELKKQLMGCPRSDIPSWGRAPPLIHNHTPKGGADFGWRPHPSFIMQLATSCCTRPMCPCPSSHPPGHTSSALPLSHGHPPHPPNRRRIGRAVADAYKKDSACRRPSSVGRVPVIRSLAGVELP